MFSKVVEANEPNGSHEHSKFNDLKEFNEPNDPLSGM